MARILVIDDDEGIRAGVLRLLERAGHEVQVAEDGRVAMRLFEANPHDVVITDINMPEMDGIEVIMALRNSGSDVPVIAMSAGGKLPKELLLLNADMLGAVASVPKPFEIADMLAAVDAALAR